MSPAPTRTIRMPPSLSVPAMAIVVAAVALPGAEPAPPARPDHSRLLIYRAADGSDRPVRSVADWERRREHILAGMQAAMGALPDRRALPALDLKVGAIERGDGFTRATVSFTSGDGDRIPAHLYRPDHLRPGTRVPAMLALHPTSPLGKDIVAGRGPLPNRGYAVELARRGLVVLAPDYPSFGELRDYDFTGDRYQSGTMKGIFNHMRCVDLLQSLPEVNADRIGVIGHSLGGHNAMFVGVFDERLKVVISSCGWTPFHDYRGGRLDGWTSERYMPRLRDVYGLNPDRVPFDFYEVVAALAPRGFFSSSPLRDDNFSVIGVMRAIPRALGVYELYGAAAHLQMRHPNCGHDFPPRVRRQAYAFADRILGFTPRRVVPEPDAGESDTDDPLDRSEFFGPWNVEALARPPRIWWGRADGQVREVFYEGEPYRGTPTRVFAYFARPRGPGPFPAMLLVHGGGGRAFREWAELWARRGFAALAMDTAGQGPGGRRLPDGGPDQRDATKFADLGATTVRDMWTYHAVAAVLRGHALLAAQESVDASRIGITGISWGGYLTCIVAGIDHRLAVAVPVYGCGFLHENSAWKPIFERMKRGPRDMWVSLFDPSRYLAGVRCPILFLNGTNDFAYPLDSYQKSYRMVPGRVDLSIQVRLPHGHQQGWAPPEIALYVEGVVAGKPGLPRLSPVHITDSDHRAAADFSSLLRVDGGRLHFAAGTGPWQKRRWESMEAHIEIASGATDRGIEGTVSAEIPDARPIVLYLAVTDERGAQVSTPHEALGK